MQHRRAFGEKDGALILTTLSLIALVFVLGIRHGLDADHLAFIDGQTRYGIRMNSRTARFVGSLFSFGHGLVVVIVAMILSTVSSHFTFPKSFEFISTWISIVWLLLLGSLNLHQLLRGNRNSSANYQIVGLKGRLIPRFARETTNPFVIAIVGALFALAADTISQTSVWAIAASHTTKYVPLGLGLLFMFGMVTTDTIDCLITYRVVRREDKRSQSASKMMGWLIVALAFSVSFYEIYLAVTPAHSVNFEVVGAVAFAIILACYVGGAMVGKNKKVGVETR